MGKESRSPNCGDIGQTGDETQAPAASVGYTVGELAQEAGITVRALRFYQSKGLLAARRDGQSGLFNQEDRDSLTFILRGKRLGFTLAEIGEMLVARAQGAAGTLPISHRKCIEQIGLLEQQRADVDRALAELRQIYIDMFGIAEAPLKASGEG
jgi:DNA-binding transcriptional MerR regulator